MKKVRYAAGALGVLGVLPALGMVTPAAPAAAPRATVAPAGKAKTVSLLSLDSAADGLTQKCNARRSGGSGVSTTLTISYSRDIGCIGNLNGVYDGPHAHSTGIWMRVREYVNGVMAYSRFNKNGRFGNNSIFFSSHPLHTGVEQVCVAIVRSTAPGTVLSGGTRPCAQTGYLPP
jgi:hypothetical protein